MNGQRSDLVFGLRSAPRVRCRALGLRSAPDAKSMSWGARNFCVIMTGITLGPEIITVQVLFPSELFSNYSYMAGAGGGN